LLADLGLFTVHPEPFTAGGLSSSESSSIPTRFPRFLVFAGASDSVSEIRFPPVCSPSFWTSCCGVGVSVLFWEWCLVVGFLGLSAWVCRLSTWRRSRTHTSVDCTYLTLLLSTILASHLSPWTPVFAHLSSLCPSLSDPIRCANARLRLAYPLRRRGYCIEYQ